MEILAIQAISNCIPCCLVKESPLRRVGIHGSDFPSSEIGCFELGNVFFRIAKLFQRIHLQFMHEASQLPFEVLACLDDLKSVFLKIRLIPSGSGGIFVHDKCLIPLPVVFENCLQTGKVEVNQHIDFDFIGSNPRQFRDCPSRCFLKKSPLKVIVFMEVISLVQRSAALIQGIFFSRIALPVVVLPQISAKGKPAGKKQKRLI